jgi:hypothetical protein
MCRTRPPRSGLYLVMRTHSFYREHILIHLLVGTCVAEQRPDQMRVVVLVCVGFRYVKGLGSDQVRVVVQVCFLDICM